MRNAVKKPEVKELAKGKEWDSKLLCEINELKELIDSNGPKLVLTFGAFAFEFTRRASGEESNHRAYSYWSAKRLGEEFRCRSEAFCAREVNVLPLLHVSIARRHFLKAHKDFTSQGRGNYFKYSADIIADILLQNRQQLPIFEE